MRILSTLLISSIALGAVANAQAPGGNRVLRNNNPYFVTSTATHATTGVNYVWGPVSPPDYSNGIGVAKGTRSYRILPLFTDSRLEDKQVDGFTMIQRLSAASGGNWLNDYEPKVEIMSCIPQVGGVVGALDPDPTNVLISVAMMPIAGGTTNQTYRLTRSFPPQNLKPYFAANGVSDIALALTWEGGEERDVAAAHSTVGSWMDGPTEWVTSGFIDPTGVVSYNTDPSFMLWFGYTTVQSSLAVTSDYGQQRIAPLTSPNLEGHSIGSYYADLATAPINLGLSVRADANYAGMFAVPLFNLAAGPALAPFPFLGMTLEINPADPLLSVFSTYIQTLDQDGDVEGLKIPIPTQAPLLGLYLGFEMVIVDPILGTIPDSTQAVWVKVWK